MTTNARIKTRAIVSPAIANDVAASRYHCVVRRLELDMTDRLNDRELMLWALIYDGSRWEHPTKEFCFRGMRYSCSLDSLGLPDLTDLLRAKIKEAFNVWLGQSA